MRPVQELIRLLLLGLLLTLSLTTRPQSPDTLAPRFSRTGVYITLGSAVMSLTGNINLQQMVWEDQRYTFGTIWIKAGYGIWNHVFNYVNGGSSVSLEMMAMSGEGAHHLEFCAGATLFYDRKGYDHHLADRENYLSENPDADPALHPIKSKSDFMHILPSGSLGYRFQKPGAPVLFRAGLGFPDAVYLGMGFCF